MERWRPNLGENPDRPTVHAMPKITPNAMTKPLVAATKGTTASPTPNSQIRPMQPQLFLDALKSPLVLILRPAKG
jgi:hypothetical protein